MSLVVDELEKKIEEEKKKLEEELKKVMQTAETAIVREVEGRTFGCWGWSVRIFRTPKPLAPPKSEETLKSDHTKEVHNVPASV